MQYKVYVVSMNEKPLMPTTNFGYVRILLKRKMAKVILSKPFTVQLLFETEENVVPTVLGLDPGRVNLAITVLEKESGDVLISSELATRNKSVPKLMKKRKAHRMIHRGCRRAKKIRRAKHSKMVFKNAKNIIQSGTLKPIKVTYIKPKPAKFLNRTRKENWLTPTANHLLETHLHYVNLICKIVPVSEIVIEYSKFDIQKLNNPAIRENEYQEGLLKGYDSAHDYIYQAQDKHCLMCKNKIKHDHHIVPQYEGGSDHPDNIAGLCKKCHAKAHTDKTFVVEIKVKKEGSKKSHDSTGILNSIMPRVLQTIQELYGAENVTITTGDRTSQARKAYGLKKTHYNDSYVIALSSVERVSRIHDILPYQFMQYRRHNRKVCDAVRERHYKSNDKKLVASNRTKRCEQKDNSLFEYKKQLKEAGLTKKKIKQSVSNLNVEPSKKRFKTPTKELAINVGCTVLYKSKRYVVNGTLNKGITLKFHGFNKETFSVEKCKLITRNSGLVCG